jgi:hypothetical protein
MDMAFPRQENLMLVYHPPRHLRQSAELGEQIIERGKNQ